MSKELTGREVHDALTAIDNAVTTAQDQGAKLRGYIDWLEEQVADRDDRIDKLGTELAETRDQLTRYEDEA